MSAQVNLCAFLLMTIVPVSVGFGHDLNLVRIELEEQDANLILKVWVSPPQSAALEPPIVGDDLEITQSRRVGQSLDQFQFQFRRRSESNEGGNILLPWQFGRAFVSVRRPDGTVVGQLLTQTPEGFVIDNDLMRGDPKPPRVSAYFGLGVEHILLGYDHLLFVLGLLLLIENRGTLLSTITAFTIAHCLTLALVTLQVIHVSNRAVEAVIALSLVLLAVEAIRKQQGESGITANSPWLVAFGFGLVHGLGFAGALAEVGLPADQIPISLLLFNLGIEVGQLMFVAVFLFGQAMLSRRQKPVSDWSKKIFPYLIGIAATYWFLDRVAAVFAA